MVISVAQFRADFSEFGDAAVYPAGDITFWLNTGYLRLPSNVWKELLDIGVELFVAHNLAIERANKKAALNGGAPGQNVGPLNSKSVSKVSAGYDTAVGAVKDAGNYNLTNFGTRFMELVDIVGAQGITQIGTGNYPIAGSVIGG